MGPCWGWMRPGCGLSGCCVRTTAPWRGPASPARTWGVSVCGPSGGGGLPPRPATFHPVPAFSEALRGHVAQSSGLAGTVADWGAGVCEYHRGGLLRGLGGPQGGRLAAGAGGPSGPASQPSRMHPLCGGDSHGCLSLSSIPGPIPYPPLHICVIPRHQASSNCGSPRPRQRTLWGAWRHRFESRTFWSGTASRHQRTRARP